MRSLALWEIHNIACISVNIIRVDIVAFLFV